jgi:hypothetical protein
MTSKIGSIQIFSPDKQENWIYQTQDFKFSSLDHGVFAIDAVGLDWSLQQPMLFKCADSTSKSGFFRVSPWFPRRSAIRDTLIRLFPSCETDGFDVFGYFEPSLQNIELLFTLWQEMGAWASGVWQIGGCFQKFQGSPFSGSGLELSWLLHEIHNIGCVLSLEEMEESTLLIRKFDSLDDFLKVLGNSN